MPGVSDQGSLERAALIRAHYSLQHGCFVSHAGALANGLLAFSDHTSAPMWNHAAWLGGASDSFREFVREATEAARTRSRRPVIYTSDASVEELKVLQERGFEKFDEEAWMIWKGDGKDLSLLAEVEEVTNQQHLESFVSIFSAAFRTREAGYANVLRQHAKGEARARHFILRDEGKAVCAGTLITGGGAGCFYNIGTPPGERGKGHATRLLRHMLAVTQANCCSVVFLQVENGSPAHRLYERLGFQNEFVRAGYRLAQWTSAENEGRSRLSALLGYERSGRTGGYLRETRPLPKPPASLADSATLRRASIGAWACLLHRYSGDDAVAFTLDGGAEGRKAVQIPVLRHSSVREWLASLDAIAEGNKEEARESLFSFQPPGNFTQTRLERYPVEVYLPDASFDRIEIAFRADLFSKDAIRRMLGHFSTIYESLLREPQSAVSDIEILSAAEKHQILVEWNQTSAIQPEKSLARMFEEQVERTPDSTALILAGAPGMGVAEQMTYRQLNRRANRLAHRLKEMGAGPEIFVGVFLDRCLDAVTALLAIWKAGAACLPLDIAYPAERLEFMLQDAAAPIVLTHRHLAGNLPENFRSRAVLLDEPSPAKRVDIERNSPPVGSLADAAYIIYTSGSTGKPKGVIVSNEAIAIHTLDCRREYGLSDKDRVLQFSSFNFDASLEQTLPALVSGATLVLRGKDVWSTREFSEVLREQQLTVIDLPTGYWHQLAEEWATNPEILPSNALRLVVVGGEALSPEKARLWQDTPAGKGRLVNAYGPTETTITATSCDIPRFSDEESEFPAAPIGRPRGGRKAYVLAPDGKPQPIGLPGELHIGGACLARGYHKRDELTASRFIPDPFSDQPDARLYKTGDLVRRRADGMLEFLGRVDDQVKVRGFRVELGEIEEMLRKHAAVSEALVLATDNGHGSKKLLAYVTCPKTGVTSAGLRTFLKAGLPEFMVPAHLVVLKEFPLLPSGKIDRQALPDPAADAGGAVNGPRDSVELQLQLLFERVLKQAPIDIGASFFELGGDSLQALELLVEIEKSTGRHLPLATLYQSSTIEAIAREIRLRGRAESWSSLVPLQTGGTRPPLFLLHTTPGDILGYGNLVYRLGPDQPCYGFQSLGLNDTSAGHTSVQEMAEYYLKLLRAAFPQGPYYLGGWCYGGIVAVEMARRLKEHGAEVAMLALLETVALPPAITNFRYYSHRIGCLLGMSPRRWLTYIREKARYNRASQIANKMRFRQVENGDPAGQDQQRDPRLVKLEHVYNTNLEALDHYRSTYYDGTVTLFNAAERDPAIIKDPQYGWVGLAKNIEIYEVPGNHDTMLFEPNVAELARELNAALERAREQSAKNHA